MSNIRYELVNSTVNRIILLTDLKIYNNIHKYYEFRKQTILTDKLLTDDEKIYAIRLLTKNYDRDKVITNSGTKRICENCKKKCLATLYCEYCIQNYLKTNFKNWTSGNNDIDDLIQKCQIKTIGPNYIVEWIPYNNLENIKYLTKGGFSEIYTADWINSFYKEWDSKNQQLKRFGSVKVVLKKLENVESANQRWFEEARLHLIISSKRGSIVRCFGLTQDLLNGNYMLVMLKMDTDLRKYLQQNYNQLTWKEKIKIVYEISIALSNIYKEKAIHKDLHSGNILYSKSNDRWVISDLGFCGPADKSSKSIYGNLPYLAPEVIKGNGYTFKSDIYSIAILMWEISSGYSPFIDYEHDDYELAMNIINGMRPEIMSDIPLEYKNLMVQCWDADPLKRPDTITLEEQIRKIHLSYRNMPNELFQSKTINNFEIKTSTNYTSRTLFTSKIYQFDNLPEQKIATKALYTSKVYDLRIPDNIDDFNEQKIKRTSKISSIFKVSNKSLSKVFETLKISSNNYIQNDHEKETIQQMKEPVNDDDEIYNNSNLHSKD
ncbi:Cmk2p [Rhizophagus irregularis DAOM 197198w]|uniref:Cmk2p n=2 Tax=Rhizophagus irregularis TaxID=588596 RepID=A0A015LDJ5_RHIIW|nr:Cmk2p [Rhizophagus irregularis DAOM 197198w]